MVSVRQKLLRKGRTYESHFDIELRDGAKAVECEPRVVGEVQVFLEQPLAEDAERRLPVAAAARELREAEEVQRGDRVVVCAEAVGGLVRLEAEEGLVFEVRRMRRLDEFGASRPCETRICLRCRSARAQMARVTAPCGSSTTA